MRDVRESPKTNAILQLITKSILKFPMHKDSPTYEYVVTYIAIFNTSKTNTQKETMNTMDKIDKCLINNHYALKKV